MSTKLATIIADFSTQLTTQIAIGGTTATLSSATDSDGVALPAGRYFFTLDGTNSSKEHISCDLSGTALTNIKSVSRQGVETTGVARLHRVGASVIISDFAHIKFMNDLVSGATDFNSAVNLGYDGAPTGLAGNDFATVTYVLSVVNGGTVNFDQQVAANQTAGETLVVNDLVYFKASDQRWWKVSAATSATYDKVRIGFAKSAGAAGASVTIAISGPVIGFTGLTAGSKYYASDTGGAISTTPGTTTVFIGWALSTTSILMDFVTQTLPTTKEKEAMVGNSGTPSSSNKFVTETGIAAAITGFGDGSDGDGTISGTTTLTSDMYYNDLSVTGTLNTAGYRVFVKGTLSGNGIIQNNGNAGSAGTPGAQGAGGIGGTATAGYFTNNAGTAGGAGPNTGAGISGNNGVASSNTVSLLVTSASSVGGNGGAAGGGGSPPAVGNGGTTGTRTAVLTKFGVIKALTALGLDVTATGSLIKDISSMPGTGGGSGPSGNGGGGSGSGGAGGGGGASGGIVAIFANVFSGTMTIKALGGAGGAGASGSGANYGGGGGGAGGNGGYIYVVYGTKTWSGSYDVTGGAGGAGAAGAGTGGTGTTGATGSAGATKEIVVTNLF